MSREWRALIISAALVVEGAFDARIGFPSFEPRQAWLAVLTLWVVGGCGLLAWLRTPESRVGPLLVAAAVAWGVASGALGSIRGDEPGARILGIAYAAIIAHAIVSFPTGRLRGHAWAPVAVGYAAGIVPSPLSQVVLATAVVVGLVLSARVSALRARPAAIVTGLVFAVGVGAGDPLTALLPAPVADVRLLAEAVLVLVSVIFSAALVREADQRHGIEDLMLKSGPSGGDALTRRLAAIVGDPTLQIGYWLGDQDRYVDPSGHPMTAVADGDRAMTPIDLNGQRVAVLIHARGRLTDATVLDAIGRAAGLASTNARLQAGVEEQRAEVDASRQRLGQAVDEEHRKLKLRLEQGLDPRLAELESALEDAGTSLPNEAGRGPLAYVREARREVAALANGLAPRALDRGLSAAISELAARSPIPVTVDAAADNPALRSTQAALYFVCSEALSNVAKHAHASAVTVRLSSADGSWAVEVSDDGVGGTDDQRGTGLRGLRDRLEAIGGRLSVESPPSGGTRVRAIVPDREPDQVARHSAAAVK